MASISFQKVKNKSTVAALMRHNDKEERLKHEHANEHIDKSRTGENLQWLSYRAAAKRFNDRIKELDATTNTNHRKDRVEAVAIEIPMPVEGLNKEEEIQISKTYLDFLSKTYGKENICGFWVHFDEKHKYRDNADGQEHESRAHIHAIVVPVVEGRLCCKLFTNKASMIEANKRLDKLVYERHGMHLMTGETAKKQSVENLKAAGKIAEIEAETRLYRDRMQAAEAELSGLKAKVEEQDTEIEKLAQAYDEGAEIIETLCGEIAKGDDLIKSGRDYLRQIEQAEAGNFTEIEVDEDLYKEAIALDYVGRSYDSPKKAMEDYLYQDER